MKISDVTGFLDQCFPRENALDYDNVGIMAGEPERAVTACVLSLDLTGKKSGRGAYVCKQVECLKKCRKRRCLERSLEVEIPEEVYDALERELAENE